MPEPLDENLCWLLSRAAQALNAELTDALVDLGISPRGHAVLTAALTGEHTQSQLARTVGLDKTTMVVTVDELERGGLAERRPSPTDRRARVIAVTPEGKRLLARSDKVHGRIKDDVLGTLDPRERDAFVGALKHLVGGRLAPADPKAMITPPPVRRRSKAPA